MITRPTEKQLLASYRQFAEDEKKSIDLKIAGSRFFDRLNNNMLTHLSKVVKLVLTQKGFITNDLDTVQIAAYIKYMILLRAWNYALVNIDTSFNNMIRDSGTGILKPGHQHYLPENTEDIHFNDAILNGGNTVVAGDEFKIIIKYVLYAEFPFAMDPRVTSAESVKNIPSPMGKHATEFAADGRITIHLQDRYKKQQKNLKSHPPTAGPGSRNN